MINISLAGFNAAYARLGVLLTDDDLAGETMYNDDLASVVAELERNGTAVIDDGALVRLRRGFQRANDRTQKRWRFRLWRDRPGSDQAPGTHLHADRMIYVVDARQSFHFDLVFAVSRKAGFLPDDVITEHVAFGTGPGSRWQEVLDSRGNGGELSIALLDAAEGRLRRLSRSPRSSTPIYPMG